MCVCVTSSRLQAAALEAYEIEYNIAALILKRVAISDHDAVKDISYMYRTEATGLNESLVIAR